MSSIVYGRAAYEGFARAIGTQLGLQVQVVDGQSACIDSGGTVQIPGMSTYQTPQEFSLTCGTIVHELAHQFYGSHKQIDPARSRLEHDCLNAVLDVADESGVEQWCSSAFGNKRPGELLANGNHAAHLRDDIYEWKTLDDAAWRILCTGILKARLPAGKRINAIGRRNSLHAKRHGVDAVKCYKLIKQALRPAKDTTGAPDPKRFGKLIKLAEQLAVILAPFAPPPGSKGKPMPGAGDVASATSKGSASMPCGSQEATEQDAQALADGQATFDSQPSKSAAQPAGASSGAAYQPRTFQASQESYQMLYPAVERIGQRIAIDGDGRHLDVGLSRGPRLGKLYRAYTDGQCFARWQDNDHADGVAVSVILDCSGSMGSNLPKCAGIARAFAQGMRQCGDVQTLAFGDVCRESDDFREVTDMGGTSTHKALAEAGKWHTGKHGALWVIIVTDGEPCDQHKTDAECHALHAQGVKILAVGLGCEIAMPHAISVTAADVNHLAIELAHAASVIERA